MEKINGTILKMFLCGSLLFSGSIYADSGSEECAAPVQPIEKGVPAPCSGYLFSPDAESEAWTTKRLADQYKKKNVLQADENSILEKRLELYKTANEDLSKLRARSESTETFIRVGYFALGVLVTAMVARNVKQ